MTLERSAYDVVNPILWDIGETIRSGDFDGFARNFFLPLIVDTGDGRQCFTSKPELETWFRDICRFRAEHGVIDTARDTIWARFNSPDTIAALHVAHQFRRGGLRFGRPMAISNLFGKVGGHWRTLYRHYSLGSPDAFGRMLIGQDAAGATGETLTQRPRSVETTNAV